MFKKSVCVKINKNKAQKDDPFHKRLSSYPELSGGKALTPLCTTVTPELSKTLGLQWDLNRQCWSEWMSGWMSEWVRDRKSKCACWKYVDMIKFWLSVSHKYILIFCEPSMRIFNSLLPFIIWKVYCKQCEWPFRITNSPQFAWNYFCFSTGSPSSLGNPSGQGKLGQLGHPTSRWLP